MIDQSPFGRTGHLSTRVIFGAASLSRMSQERADSVLEILLEFGINHIDTAASYGDSELRVAPWLRSHQFFLATKTGARTGSEARAGLELSLSRLGVDHVDLIQLHNLVEEDDWETAHGPGGAVEALAQARQEGLTRYVGVTGHGLRIARMHLRSLDRFDFDSVLLPYNYSLLQVPEYGDAVTELLQRCQERRVAVQTIKSLARRRWTNDDQPHYSWYEPLPDAGAVDRSVRWVLSHGNLFLNTSSDAHLLRPTLEAASRLADPPPAAADMEADQTSLGIRPLFDGADLERI
jgi:aryl-alcohol dehydrogenase-like predicted oxidoreductase